MYVEPNFREEFFLDWVDRNLGLNILFMMFFSERILPPPVYVYSLGLPQVSPLSRFELRPKGIYSSYGPEIKIQN